MKNAIGIALLTFLTAMLPAVAEGGTHVVLETSKGTIVLELADDKAPISTKNFLDYVTAGFYDGTVFHRVIPGFMIQGGGFGPNLERKETSAPIKNEGQNGLRNDRGTIAMARTSNPDSATSQFFINSVDNNSLNYPNNGGYAVFGKVIEGMDIADAIAGVSTTRVGAMANVPVEDVKIIKASVREAAPVEAKEAATKPQ